MQGGVGVEVTMPYLSLWRLKIVFLLLLLRLDGILHILLLEWICGVLLTCDVIDSKPSSISPSYEHFDITNNNGIKTTNAFTTTSTLNPTLHESYGSNETMWGVASHVGGKELNKRITV